MTHSSARKSSPTHVMLLTANPTSSLVVRCRLLSPWEEWPTSKPNAEPKKSSLHVYQLSVLCLKKWKKSRKLMQKKDTCVSVLRGKDETNHEGVGTVGKWRGESRDALLGRGGGGNEGRRMWWEDFTGRKTQRFFPHLVAYGHFHPRQQSSHTTFFGASAFSGPE